MSDPRLEPDAQGNEHIGFCTLDDDGRIQLPAAARTALDLQPGTRLHYVIADGKLMLLPERAELAALSDHAAQILAAHRLTVQDLLDELPAARQRVYEETYSPEFHAELEREWRKYHPDIEDQ